MKQSLDSTRPILNMAEPKSNRFSTYSMVAPSETSWSSQSTHADLKNYNSTLERLQNQRLQDQRFTISTDKEDTLEKLALFGKLQKALDRRYSGQDATMKPTKPKPKKTALSPLSEKAAAR